MLKDNTLAGEGNSYSTEFRMFDARLGRWLSLDPLMSQFPWMSPFVAFDNNPIYYTDPYGLSSVGEGGGGNGGGYGRGKFDDSHPTQPGQWGTKKRLRGFYKFANKCNLRLRKVLKTALTAGEAARMAAHVYGDKSDDILTGGWKVSKRDFGIHNDTKSGLKSQVYERTNEDGVTENVYATAGTEDRKDVKHDVIQPFGLSKQYKESTRNAEKIKEQLGKGVKLTFVGHSLGGGEAVANAYATGLDAVTFNAAGVSIFTKRRNKKSRIDAFIMKTDPLNAVQNNITFVPDVNGKRHYVLPINSNSFGLKGHSMENMLKAFGVVDPELYDIPTPEDLMYYHLMIGL